MNFGNPAAQGRAAGLLFSVFVFRFHPHLSCHLNHHLNQKKYRWLTILYSVWEVLRNFGMTPVQWTVGWLVVWCYTRGPQGPLLVVKVTSEVEVIVP